MIFSLKKFEIENLITELRVLESTCNLDLQGELLSEVWHGFESEPIVEIENADELSLEFFRICGVYFSRLGESLNNSDYSDRGKDLLFRAMQEFNKIGDSASCIESACQLSHIYTTAGDFPNAEVILNYAEENLPDTASDSYLLIQIHRIVLFKKNRKYTEAQRLIERITEEFKNIEDAKLLYMFHTETGIIYRLLSQFQKSIWHYRKAVESANILNNEMYLAKSFNNLAFVSVSAGDLPQAEEYSRKSIEYARSMKDISLLANFYDTLAGIKIKTGENLLAQLIIEKVLEMLGEDGDTNLISDALVTQSKIYLNQNQYQKASETVERLYEILADRLGHKEADAYVMALNNELLGLSFEFENISVRKSIELFPFDGTTSLRDDARLLFLPENFARNIGVDTDCLIAVGFHNYELDQPNLIWHKETNTLEVGVVKKEAITGIYFYESWSGEIISLDSSKIKLTKIAGYIPYDEFTGDHLVFYEFL